MRTVIIGGGIGGLATAYRLQKDSLQAGMDRHITVLEASSRWGGVIETVTSGDTCLELGPDAVVSTKPAALTLIRELGLESHIIGVEPLARRAFIARGNDLVPVPDGLYLMAPARLWPFAMSRMVSWCGKLRMALDLVLPRQSADAPEESLGQFVRRRLGREALSRIAQPLISGIYSADPEQLSLSATMPQFLEMERQHRSLILALRARGKSAEAHGSGPRYGLFAALRGGMSVMVDALVKALKDADLRTGISVVELQRRGEQWRVFLSDGTHCDADDVVLAVPAHVAGALLARIDAWLSTELLAIPYATIATVNFVFDRAQIPRLPSGAGFVVPSIENRVLLACTVASEKFSGRAPADQAIVRACAGGSQRHADLALDDEALTDALLRDLRDLMGVQGQPKSVVVRRWPAALPQYLVGHQARVARIRTLEASVSGLALVGNAYEGTGIPDVIATAERAANRLAISTAHALVG